MLQVFRSSSSCWPSRDICDTWVRQLNRADATVGQGAKALPVILELAEVQFRRPGRMYGLAGNQ